MYYLISKSTGQTIDQNEKKSKLRKQARENSDLKVSMFPGHLQRSGKVKKSKVKKEEILEENEDVEDLNLLSPAERKRLKRQKRREMRMSKNLHYYDLNSLDHCFR